MVLTETDYGQLIEKISDGDEYSVYRISCVDIKTGKEYTNDYKFLNVFNKYRNMEPWLHINSEEWSELKSKYDEELLRESLVVLLCTYPLAKKDISLDDCKEDFLKLCEYDTVKMEKHGDFIVKGENITVYSGEYLSSPNTGLKCSDYFQQENRMMSDIGGSPGPHRTWTNHTFMYSLTRSFFTLKLEEITQKKVKTCLALRKGMASQFKPTIAKYFYDRFQAKNVLDFSSGWGDRFAAFYASKHGEHYVGVDPNERLHPKYKQQYDLYSKLRGEDRHTQFIASPAEEVDFLDLYGENYFDLCLTSPPYFNRECYTYDETQSYKKFRNFDNWLEEFLFTTMRNIEPTIKSGGHMVINIADIYSTSLGYKKKTWLPILKPMCDYVKDNLNFEFVGVVGYKMAKRPNLKSVGTAVISNGVKCEKELTDIPYCEPCFVWRKK